MPSLAKWGKRSSTPTTNETPSSSVILTLTAPKQFETTNIKTNRIKSIKRGISFAWDSGMGLTWKTTQGVQYQVNMKLQTFIGYKHLLLTGRFWKQDLKKHHVPQHLQLHYPSLSASTNMWTSLQLVGSMGLSVTGRCEKVVGVGDAWVWTEIS